MFYNSHTHKRTKRQIKASLDKLVAKVNFHLNSNYTRFEIYKMIDDESFPYRGSALENWIKTDRFMYGEDYWDLHPDPYQEKQ